MKRLLDTAASVLVIIIRLMVGMVFLLEGLQKFLYPADLGAGRFAKIGLPAAEILGPFVGAVETLAGALVLVGLLTRPAAAALAIIMIVAIITTKIPILLGHEFIGFSLRKLDRYGFLSMAHETRTDWAMLLGSIYLMISGGGSWSADRALMRKHRPPAATAEPLSEQEL